MVGARFRAKVGGDDGDLVRVSRELERTRQTNDSTSKNNDSHWLSLWNECLTKVSIALKLSRKSGDEFWAACNH